MTAANIYENKRPDYEPEGEGMRQQLNTISDAEINDQSLNTIMEVN